MIRIYLDWNVFSNLKRDSYLELREFLENNSASLLIPYSPAHFTDLMKSYSDDNHLFFKDLETLDKLCKTNLLRWEKDITKGLIATPTKYFERTKGDKLTEQDFNFESLFSELGQIGSDVGLSSMGDLLKKIMQLTPTGIEINEENQKLIQKLFPNIKSNSSLWDLIIDMGPTMNKLLNDGTFYKDFRSSIADEGFKLDPNSGQWNEDDVLKNIDDYLKKIGTDLTYFEYVEESLKHNKDGYTYYQFFTTAYLMLDMIGYKQDRLKKPTDNMGNIQADADHAFYAAHCDYFVCGDKILRTKSKILYNEFNLSTKVFKPEEFLTHIKKASIPNIKDNLLADITEFINEDNFITYRKDKEVVGIESYYRLPVFFLNYFNSMVINKIDSDQINTTITLRRVFNNYSDFIFYTEVDYVFDKVIEVIGYENISELTEVKKQFVYERDFDGIIWELVSGVIHFTKDKNYRPELTLYLNTNQIKNDD